MVHEHETQVLHAKGLKASIDGISCSIITPIHIKQFAGDKDLVPRNAAISDCLPHVCLIAIHTRSVNMAISTLKAAQDCVVCFSA